MRPGGGGPQCAHGLERGRACPFSRRPRGRPCPRVPALQLARPAPHPPSAPGERPPARRRRRDQSRQARAVGQARRALPPRHAGGPEHAQRAVRQVSARGEGTGARWAPARAAGRGQRAAVGPSAAACAAPKASAAARATCVLSCSSVTRADRVVTRGVAAGRGYDAQRFLADYVAFMTTPGGCSWSRGLLRGVSQGRERSGALEAGALWLLGRAATLGRGPAGRRLLHTAGPGSVEPRLLGAGGQALTPIARHPLRAGSHDDT